MDLSAFSSPHYSFAKCIVELVLNSLEADAACVAIRIYNTKRVIYVIDNGKGITRRTLTGVGEHPLDDLANLNPMEKHTLSRIRRLTEKLSVTSRTANSERTYAKIFKPSAAPQIIETEKRPSHGTTVCVYGFYDLSHNKWDWKTMYYAIGNMALNNPNVSFTIRDMETERVVLALPKPRRPILVVPKLYPTDVTQERLWFVRSASYFESPSYANLKFGAFIGFPSPRPAKQYVFLNNRPVCDSQILRCITSVATDCVEGVDPESIFILLFIGSNRYSFSEKDGLVLPNIRNLIEAVRMCVADNCSDEWRVNSMKRGGFQQQPITLDIDQHPSNKSCEKNLRIQRRGVRIVKTKITEKVSRSPLTPDFLEELCGFITPEPKRMRKTITENFTFSISQLSNWSYHSSEFHLKKESQKNVVAIENKGFPIRKRFDFLPAKLHALVPNPNRKLITRKTFSGSGMSIISMKRRYGLRVSETLNHQELDVRPCKIARKFCEFRFDKSHLACLQVLGQICNEVIAGLLNRSDMKVLMLIDQHAIHERIRYEDLLKKYTSFGRREILSVRLKEPIVIELPGETYDSVISNKDLLRKYGIKFNSLKRNILIAHSVPECFKKTKYHQDEVRLKTYVQSLINEVVQGVDKSCPFSVLNLPPTLQTVIATEACHGAIRFGDRLSLEQCRSLVELLKSTKIPTQCAHGRPSIIPMLDLSDWERTRENTIQVHNTSYFLKLAIQECPIRAAELGILRNTGAKVARGIILLQHRERL